MLSRDRIYKVRLPDGSYRPVEAISRRRAISHVADSLFNVEVAFEDDVCAGHCDGVKVEFPGAQELVESSESPAN